MQLVTLHPHLELIDKLRAIKGLGPVTESGEDKGEKGEEKKREKGRRAPI